MPYPEDRRLGTSRDVNNNGIPDECDCLGDIDGDWIVGPPDLTLLLAACYTAPGDPRYNGAADLNGDKFIGAADLTILLANWLTGT